MRWERLAAASRHPLGRSGIRRSTVVFVGVFVVLAGLLSYHHVTTGPAGRSDVTDACPPQFVVCVPAEAQHARSGGTSGGPPTTRPAGARSSAGAGHSSASSHRFVPVVP